MKLCSDYASLVAEHRGCTQRYIFCSNVILHYAEYTKASHWEVEGYKVKKKLQLFYKCASDSKYNLNSFLIRKENILSKKMRTERRVKVEQM